MFAARPLRVPAMHGVTQMVNQIKPVAATLRALSRDRRAVTALEYGIIAGVLGLNLIGIFKRFGTGLSTLFSTISSSI